MGFSSKTERGDLLIRVIAFYDVPDPFDDLLVLVGLIAHVVEGIGGSRGAI